LGAVLAEALLSGLPADPELVADGLPAVSALTRPTDRRVQGMASGAQVSLGRGKPGQDVHCGRLERTRALPLAQGGAPGGAGGAQPGRDERNDGSEPAVGPGVRLGGVAAQRRRLGVKSGFRYARQREAGRAPRAEQAQDAEDRGGHDRQGPARTGKAAIQAGIIRGALPHFPVAPSPRGCCRRTTSPAAGQRTTPTASASGRPADSAGARTTTRRAGAACAYRGSWPGTVRSSPPAPAESLGGRTGR